MKRGPSFLKALNFAIGFICFAVIFYSGGNATSTIFGPTITIILCTWATVWLFQIAVGINKRTTETNPFTQSSHSWHPATEHFRRGEVPAGREPFFGPGVLGFLYWTAITIFCWYMVYVVLYPYIEAAFNYAFRLIGFP